MKKCFVSFMISFVLIFAIACDLSQGDKAENEQMRQTRELLSEVNKELGLPAIKNFQEKKLAKMIFELRDQENLVCYAYIKSDYQGKLMFIGKCIGYGLPYSIQYTNPMKPITGTSPIRDETTIPQADPNGLYMPTGLSATWLMMIDKKTGKARPVYIEPEIVVSPFPLH